MKNTPNVYKNIDQFIDSLTNPNPKRSIVVVSQPIGKERLEDKLNPMNGTFTGRNYYYGKDECKGGLKKPIEVTEDPILYIVFNRSSYMSSEKKAVIASHLTSKFVKCFEIASIDNKLAPTIKSYEEWSLSYGGYGNTVLLEASEEEIYTNMMSNYDDVFMVKHIEDTERYTGSKFSLSLPEHSAFLFFGRKSDMPSWILNLPLLRF